jgi:hypothetical protein
MFQSPSVVSLRRVSGWCGLVIVLLLTGTIPRVSHAEAAKLSLIKESDFPGWLKGTEWQYAASQGTRKLWFVTKDVLIFGRPEEKGGKSECSHAYAVQKKGVVRCFHGTSEKTTLDLTISEDATQGSVKDSESGQAYAAKCIGRRDLPAAPKMKGPEFAAWLKKNPALSGGSGHITFESDTTAHVKINKGDKHCKIQIIRPGLVEFVWGDNIYDPTLICFDPDLKSARRWHWWGNVKSPVAFGASTPSGKSPGVTKTGPVSIPNMPEIPLTGRSASVSALMVQDLGNSHLAGKASRLSLSALPQKGGKPATVAFNQAVGSMMDKALREVARFHAIRHEGWPRGNELQLTFEDKFTSKDGPSAAVACALLLESVFTGTALDPEFAVTGDMNADGSVQSIGGVHAKLRGATNFKCKLLGIPARNDVHAVDLVLTEGLKPFTGIQVFALGNFDEAFAVARADKTPELAAAISDFTAFVKAFSATPQAMRTPDAIGKLQSILQRAPTHFSAKVLLDYATDKLPKSLSPSGSLAELDQSIGDLHTAIDGDLAAANSLDGGQISKARLALQRLRPLADARVRPLIDAWVNWGSLADKLAKLKDSITAKDREEWKAAGARINVEYKKLRTNESFREDLE